MRNSTPRTGTTGPQVNRGDSYPVTAAAFADGGKSKGGKGGGGNSQSQAGKPRNDTPKTNTPKTGNAQPRNDKPATNTPKIGNAQPRNDKPIADNPKTGDSQGRNKTPITGTPKTGDSQTRNKTPITGTPKRNSVTDSDRGNRSKSTTGNNEPLTTNDSGRGKDTRQPGASKTDLKSATAQPTRKPVTPITNGAIDGRKIKDIAARQGRQDDADAIGKAAGGAANAKDRDGRGNATDQDRPRTLGGNDRDQPGDADKNGGNRQRINDRDQRPVNVNNNTNNNTVIVNNNNQNRNGSYRNYGYRGRNFGGFGGFGYGGFGDFGYGGFGGYYGGLGYGGYGGNLFGYRSPYCRNNYFSLALGYGGLGFGYGSPNFGFSYYSPYYDNYSYYSPYVYRSYYGPVPAWTSPVCYSYALPYVSTSYVYSSDVILENSYDYGPAIDSTVPLVYDDVPQPSSVLAKPALESDAGTASPDELTDAQRFMVEGEDAFQRGDYKASAKSAEHALLENPENGRVLLFISQSLFAQADYQGSIAAAYQGLSLLDSEDWGFVVANRDSYYGDLSDYQAQLEKLDTFIKENPDAAYAYALRGYHRGFAGDKVQAAVDLKKAVELESRDEFAKQLLEMFTAEPKLEPAKEGAEELILPPPAPPAVDE